MSADQELAATGGSSIISAVLTGVALIGAGIVLSWRKIARRSADKVTN